MTRLSDGQQKNRTCQRVDIDIPAEHRLNTCWWAYLSAEMQSMYSPTPANWAELCRNAMHV